MTKLLDNINSPEDIKNLSMEELQNLCKELRSFLVEKISKTGGHLASNLGVVELTVAIHKVFNLPDDKLIWDVGHQSYVHKILTGRKDEFDTLRKYGGISGFPKTKESEYDFFNTGHSSTSISAALGMALARELSGEKFNVLSVFGDGAFTGGMMYEALNNAGQSGTKLILILNDNEMSISDNVGAISKYLCKLRTKKGYYHSKDKVSDFLNKMPVAGKTLTKVIKGIKNSIKHLVLPNNFFDDLGFKYLGPIDGHNLKDLINILEISKMETSPVFIHVKTVKGKGYEFAENNPRKFHGISPFDAESGEIINCNVKNDYSAVFGNAITNLAENNEKVVAITGAMPGGTGLVPFMTRFPDRFFDVGIAEQHAVTMGAGLAISGYIPVIPIYSSFMQRAYDQILHDVCLQKLHVVFCLDRAGIVGADGETHHGMYDIGFMAEMPYMSVLSPSSFRELEEMLDYAVNVHNAPIAIRYPRGSEEYEVGEFEFGKGKKLADGKDVLLISTGRMTKRAVEVLEELKKNRITAGVIILPTVVPVDKELIFDNLAPVTAVIEDHSKESGLSKIISGILAEENKDTVLLNFGFPNEPIVHGSILELDKHYKLDSESICLKIKEVYYGRKNQTR